MSEQMVPIDSIVEAGDNTREEIGDVTELAESIKRFGILQKLIVTDRGEGKFLLAAGHRRLAAAKLARLTEVPVVIRDLNDDERLEIMITENTHRKPLNIREEANAFKRLIKKGWTQQAIADKLGLSQTTIANKLRFLDLPRHRQQAVIDGKVGLQRALLEIRQHRGEHSPRAKYPVELAVDQVFVVVGLKVGQQPPVVEVAARDDRAAELKAAMSDVVRTWIFPATVDRATITVDFEDFLKRQRGYDRVASGGGVLTSMKLVEVRGVAA